MIQKVFFGLMFLAIVCIYACQAPAAQGEAIDMDKLRAELQAMEDAYAAGDNDKDVDAIVAYYADDAQSLSNDEPTVVGKAAITERIRENMESDTSGTVTRFEVVDVFASGNLAVEVGKSISTKPDGSQTSGKYMSLFEKRDGKYVCIRDIWNRDAKADDDDEEDEEDDGDE